MSMGTGTNGAMGIGEADGMGSAGEVDIMVGLRAGAGMDTGRAGAGRTGSAAKAGTGEVSGAGERGWSVGCSATLS